VKIVTASLTLLSLWDKWPKCLSKKNSGELLLVRYKLIAI